ncbi:putative NAD(P)H steroid dehydrogenase [Streptomyces ambofaciens ATCC 23877]|uniref:Putative NAD(P)H steroid dehydrogenase n=1 Tax=Streptomyces ambofaciens (strain ATCC 23877 / 3486 / DSM 40053 / JCM 4204 / NBRC 12836 / NRRL B-2516) TaxID=278992 RepID=A0ABY0_STRA7|nr:NAD-dependent epimerase/dehydratase family protein [Streptomyces ambofaciens]AKZ60390.1 putative NAD(P)H steroid dehydrogenase [Streptomyces ambofaciens ATCC 23877]CAJ87983.1 putative NAD(P)H steroid dehydrogenase [Streptomyces ambofaciens ATCC 23877]
MKVLVTGGSGFLGLEICRRLSARGDVASSLHRRPSGALQQLGVHQHLGDLTDADAVSRAVAGCDAVIHNAALAGVSGPPRPYWATNVLGTRHVIEQCRAHGVRTLLYTSTASVVFRPGGLEGATESLPTAPRHLAAYPATKARAEALVLAAHGPELATVSLRPHIIWGPGDPHFAPVLARAVRAGRLLMPGDGANLIDTTHVRTAAHAHLLALDSLRRSPQTAGGRAYFIGQGDPRPLREITRHFLRAAGIDARWCAVPPRLATIGAAVGDTILRAARSTRTHALSRFLVAELLHPHYFDLTAARRDLDFAPPVGFDAGIAELSLSIPNDSEETPCRTPTTPSAPS